MRKTAALLTFLLVILAFAFPVLAAPDHKAVFVVGQKGYTADGQAKQMDAAAFAEQGRTYVPVRYLALALGVPEDKITWSPSAGTVTLIRDKVTVVLAVGGKVMYVNDEPKQMDVAPVVRNGRTYLPARFVAEAFGYEVGWNPGSQAVLVGPKGNLPEPPRAQNSVRVVPAVVTSVSDGDTVHVQLAGKDEKVRFTGVNCPEIAHPELRIEEQPFGKEAAAYTRERLSGKTVYLEFDVQERDKYGRLLAYVWLERPSSGSEEEVRAKMFNARLLLDGYAQVMTVPPNVKYADMFVKFQREAREKGKGLWGAAPVAPTGKAGSGTRYIGNSNSKKFHRPDCQWAQKIAPQNRVEFRSREEAVKAGYVPCKVCRP
ncbi:stalk domain-containing protein [Desulfofundulus thermosubterraneus]|uniref:Endonuclease YncB, thermonuclease family n=1 Tax=Desulfofundulus thermosubterraneus DSM 16057 TaxID=1121432 RepID=A0A1M6GYA5_9FIRM|nr:stalk domain-containing protein [Desulfofundulus thermosubterraneus]SHJ14890.1 Endonuclease YncB, thermonuclease family [Desulfofundulus thermosubterraneus DSM 16057]